MVDSLSNLSTVTLLGILLISFMLSPSCWSAPPTATLL